MFIQDPDEPAEPFREPELRYTGNLVCDLCGSAPPEISAEEEGNSCPCGGVLFKGGNLCPT